MMHGFPISAKLPEDLGFGERFWYWRGVSGQAYIHSIYSHETCPPLPGAVFVTVRRTHGIRLPVAVGRFPSSLGTSFDVSACIPPVEAGDELHVHLLARDGESAGRVLADLSAALDQHGERLVEARGFAEPCQLVLIEA